MGPSNLPRQSSQTATERQAESSQLHSPHHCLGIRPRSIHSTATRYVVQRDGSIQPARAFAVSLHRSNASSLSGESRCGRHREHGADGTAAQTDISRQSNHCVQQFETDGETECGTEGQRRRQSQRENEQQQSTASGGRVQHEGDDEARLEFDERSDSTAAESVRERYRDQEPVFAAEGVRPYFVSAAPHRAHSYHGELQQQTQVLAQIESSQ
mmetsp:Transcript_53342/g.85202  ORF Transcript_53342/g.85202 Transcript_53342/m.85202 type:complete len:213 (+) Transcript_53342:316-954(+)